MKRTYGDASGYSRGVLQKSRDVAVSAPRDFCIHHSGTGAPSP